MKIKNLIRTLGLSGLIGIAGLTGCDKPRKIEPKTYPQNFTMYVTTANKVELEPYYENPSNHYFMEGIQITKYSRDIKGTFRQISRYPRGTREYDFLRPLLTVEK